MPRALFSLLFCFLILLIPPLASSQPATTFLNLDQLIEEALENNAEILAAKKKEEVFNEKIPQAAALEDPMLEFGIINLPTSFSFREEGMTMKEISISQKLPYPGKRPLMREMAEKEAEAVSIEVGDITNRIIKEIKMAYFELSHIYRAREVTQRNKKILENLVKIAETRYATGEGIQQDVLKAHLEISRMVIDLIMLEQNRVALEAKLCSLLNRSGDCAMGEPEELIFRRFHFQLEDLQKAALVTNPALQRVKKVIEAKERAYGLAKLDYYPDFRLRFGYGQRNDSLESERSDVITGMVEMNIPIFYNSKQSRKVAESLADIQSIQAQYDTMKNEIYFMIASTASIVQRTERQLDLYKTGIIHQANLQLKSAFSAYTVNKVNFITLLDSHLTLYRYELEYHETLTEYEKNLSNLEVAVGKQFHR